MLSETQVYTRIQSLLGSEYVRYQLGFGSYVWVQESLNTWAISPDNLGVGYAQSSGDEDRLELQVVQISKAMILQNRRLHMLACDFESVRTCTVKFGLGLSALISRIRPGSLLIASDDIRRTAQPQDITWLRSQLAPHNSQLLILGFKRQDHDLPVETGVDQKRKIGVVRAPNSGENRSEVVRSQDPDKKEIRRYRTSYGWRVIDGVPTSIPEEQKAIQQIREYANLCPGISLLQLLRWVIKSEMPVYNRPAAAKGLPGWSLSALQRLLKQHNIVVGTRKSRKSKSGIKTWAAAKAQIQVWKREQPGIQTSAIVDKLQAQSKLKAIGRSPVWNYQKVYRIVRSLEE